jgi:hypothetical protein
MSSVRSVIMLHGRGTLCSDVLLGARLLRVGWTYRECPVNLPRVRLLVHMICVQWFNLIYVTRVSDSRSKIL